MSTLTKFAPVKNITHNLWGIIKRVFWICVWIICVIFGGLAFLISLRFLIGAILDWQWSSFFNSFMWVFGLIATTLTGATFMLLPFRRWAPFKTIIQFLVKALEAYLKVGGIFAGLGAIYSIFVTFVFTVLVILHYISVRLSWGLNDLVSMYISLTSAALVFTFIGQKAVRPIVGKESKENSWVFFITQPSFIRFALYCATALIYFWANFETFSHLDIIPWDWWKTLKEVIVQVLLTYVAIDGVFVTWRDRKDDLKDKLQFCMGK